MMGRELPESPTEKIKKLLFQHVVRTHERVTIDPFASNKHPPKTFSLTSKVFSAGAGVHSLRRDQKFDTS